MLDLMLRFETETAREEVATFLLGSTVSGVNTIERVGDTVFFTTQPNVPADVEGTFSAEEMPEIAGVGTDGTLEAVDDDKFGGIPKGSTEPMPEDPTIDPAPPVEDPNTGSSDPAEPNTGNEDETVPVEVEPSPPEPSEPEPVQENPTMAHLRDIRDAVEKEMEEVRSEEGDN